VGRNRLQPIAAGDVWDALTSAYGVSGSYAKLLEDYLDASVSKAAKFAELNALGLQFWKRAATLGTDGGDGGYAIAHAQAAALEPLYTRMTTGNTSGNIAQTFGAPNIARAARTPVGGVGGTLVIEARVKLEQTATCGLAVGIKAVNAVVDDGPGVYFFYDTTVAVNWQAKTYAAAAELTDTGVAGSTSWVTLRIVIIATSAKFYVNGTLVATHSTQIPDAGLANYMNNAIVILATRAAAVKYARYEYVAVYNEV